MSRISAVIATACVMLVPLACGSSSSSALFNGGGATPEAGAPAAGGSAGAGGDSAGAGGSLAGAGGSLGGAGGTPAGSGGAASGGAPVDGGTGKPETGPPVTCPARSFTGTAAGSNYVTVLGTMNVTVDIAFTVSATGAISGTWTGKTPVTSNATIVGTLDCKTNAVSLEITNGSYVVGLPPLGTAGTYTGTMEGHFVQGSGKFDGTWTIQENNPAYGGSGTWIAN